LKKRRRFGAKKGEYQALVREKNRSSSLKSSGGRKGSCAFSKRKEKKKVPKKLHGHQRYDSWHVTGLTKSARISKSGKRDPRPLLLEKTKTEMRQGSTPVGQWSPDKSTNRKEDVEKTVRKKICPQGKKGLVNFGSTGKIVTQKGETPHRRSNKTG